MSDPNPELRQRIADALGSALMGEGEMLTGWVVVLETIGVEGDRGLWACQAEDTTDWGYIGMLRYALEHPAFIHYDTEDDE